MALTEQLARTEAEAAERMQSALEEIDRLSGSLENAEEQLWEAKRHVLADREQIALLESNGALRSRQMYRNSVLTRTP